MPVVAVAGGEPPMTGGLFAACTAIEKAASESLALPSDTEITMLEVVPANVGVPLNWPELVLKVAHEGLFAILNVSVWPSGSDAVGVKVYDWPAVTDAGGVPLMTGGLFVASTVIEKLESETVAAPSDTEITMLDVVPRLLDVGVPLNRPVAVLKVAQAGRFVIEKLIALPSGSDADGWNA